MRLLLTLFAAASFNACVVVRDPTPVPVVYLGDALYTWSLHADSLISPGEACKPGEFIVFELEGREPLSTDCYLYSSQPDVRLPTGTYRVRATLYYNDPRTPEGPNIEPGGNPDGSGTILETDFTVFADEQTVVHFNFVVLGSGARREGAASPEMAPSREAAAPTL